MARPFAQYLGERALAGRGQSEAGLECVHTGLAGWQATGAEVALPHFFALQAEIHSRDEHVGEGLTRLDEALSVVEKNGERYYEAELYRMKGEFVLQSKVESRKSKVESPKSKVQSRKSKVESPSRRVFSQGH